MLAEDNQKTELVQGAGKSPEQGSMQWLQYNHVTSLCSNTEM